MFNFEEYLNESYSEDDIIYIIKNGGYIFTDSVYDLPEHKSDEPLIPIEVSDDIVMINIDGNLYKIDIENIKKIKTNV